VGNNSNKWAYLLRCCSRQREARGLLGWVQINKRSNPYGIGLLGELMKLQKARPAIRMRATLSKKSLLTTNDYDKGEESWNRKIG
jgi:hypothetical protein